MSGYTGTGRATVACRWCSKPTEYLGTRECDPCHSLHVRLRMADPVVLAKMLVDLKMTELAAELRKGTL